MGGTLGDAGHALTYLKNMIYRLVGQAVICQGIETADAVNNGPGFSPRT